MGTLRENSYSNFLNLPVKIFNNLSFVINKEFFTNTLNALLRKALLVKKTLVEWRRRTEAL